MTTITLEFDIEKLKSYYESDTGYYDVETVESAIIEAAGRALIKHLERSLEKSIADEVSAIVSETVTSKVGAIIDGVLDEKMQRTNEWGEKKGEPLTLREMIAREKEAWLSERVNNEGKAVGNSYGTYDTRLQYLMKAYVKDRFGKEISAELQKTVDDLKAQMKDNAREALVKSVEKIAGLNL